MMVANILVRLNLDNLDIPCEQNFLKLATESHATIKLGAHSYGRIERILPSYEENVIHIKEILAMY